MKEVIIVTFETNHKMIDSSLRRVIQIRVEVPKYYPTGIALTDNDIERYIEQYYGFKVEKILNKKL